MSPADRSRAAFWAVTTAGIGTAVAAYAKPTLEKPLVLTSIVFLLLALEASHEEAAAKMVF